MSVFLALGGSWLGDLHFSLHVGRWLSKGSSISASAKLALRKHLACEVRHVVGARFIPKM